MEDPQPDLSSFTSTAPAPSPFDSGSTLTDTLPGFRIDSANGSSEHDHIPQQDISPQEKHSEDKVIPYLETESVGNGEFRKSSRNDRVPRRISAEYANRRTVYMIRKPWVDDSSLRTKVKLAQLHLEEAIKHKDVIRAALELKRASKVELLDKLKVARDKERVCREATQKKRAEIGPVQAALNKIKATENEISSEEELNDRITYLQHRIQHESIPLKEEKQLIREIKQLELHRSQVSANVAAYSQLVENYGPKQDLQDHCSILYQELDILRSEQFQARAECDPIEKELGDLNVKIDELVKQLENAKKSQRDAHGAIKELKKLVYGQNSEYYGTRDEIQKAKELASAKKWDDLTAMCHEQVEGFFAQWNSDSNFRLSYIKNNEPSTIRRLQTLDGRSLGPDEELPLLTHDDENALHKEENVPPDGGMSRKKESKSVGGSIAKTTQTADKVDQSIMDQSRDTILSSKHAKTDNKKSKSEIPQNSEDSQASADVSLPKASAVTNRGIKEAQAEKPIKEDPAIREAQAKELKEKRRQEEMAKAKEAAERKKRQAERAQAKALYRAQKEAERKEKEREKKARKLESAKAVKDEISESVDVSIQESEETQAPAEESKNFAEKNNVAPVAGSLPPQRRKPRVKKLESSGPVTRLLSKKVQHVHVWAWGLFLLVVIVTIGLGYMTIV